MFPKRRKNKRLHFTGKQGDATLSQCAVASPMSSPREGEGGLSAGEPGCDGGPGSAPGQCLWKPNTRAFCGPVPTLGVDNRVAHTLLPEDPRESAYSGPCAPGGWRLGKPAADFAARHGSVSEVHRHTERENQARETARAGGLGQEARGCRAGGQKGVCLGGWDERRLERGGASFPLGFRLQAGFPRATRLTPHLRGSRGSGMAHVTPALPLTGEAAGTWPRADSRENKVCKQPLPDCTAGHVGLRRRGRGDGT